MPACRHPHDPTTPHSVHPHDPPRVPQISAVRALARGLPWQRLGGAPDGGAPSPLLSTGSASPCLSAASGSPILRPHGLASSGMSLGSMCVCSIYVYLGMSPHHVAPHSTISLGSMCVFTYGMYLYGI